jgi:hypothetical protein
LWGLQTLLSSSMLVAVGIFDDDVMCEERLRDLVRRIGCISLHRPTRHLDCTVPN